jgi:hypothetical protein
MGHHAAHGAVDAVQRGVRRRWRPIAAAVIAVGVVGGAYVVRERLLASSRAVLVCTGLEAPLVHSGSRSGVPERALAREVICEHGACGRPGSGSR